MANPKKKNPGWGGCLVLLVMFGGLVAVLPFFEGGPPKTPSPHQAKFGGASGRRTRPKNPGLLRVQREDAAKSIVRGLMSNANAARFNFEERGPNTLRMHARSAELVGGYLVFDLTYPPGSAVASNVVQK